MHADSVNSQRQYDLVVWGASGFTGRLVVEYLVKKYPLGGDLRWAVAGRDRSKLESVLAEVPGSNQQPPMIIADSHDEASLQKLTESTRVVLTTVGPYASYGSELVAACVRNGTHYCDLAGEVQWMRAMID
ncbi:MAG: saccharopine dehydrogenase, partial [Gammaproteobacteria bacterium]